MTKKAQYSTSPYSSKGRLHQEEESINRNPYQRDRDRVIHSDSFRLLKHKTQVFVAHTGDYYRTRLTHSLEVSQIARTVARRLGIDEDLSEVLALAHDLGHPPFAHSGEDVLNSCMKAYDGFDHNAQTLRILTTLEERYPLFNGLNLTWETLEGIAKHNGPLENPHIAIKDFNKIYDLGLNTFPGLEAQIASLSDDIAYNNHDLDDGLRANLFTENDISNLPIVGECFSLVDAKYPNLDPIRRRNEALRRIFNEMVEDVIINSQSLIKNSSLSSSKEVRNLGYQIIQFSPRMIESINEIRTYLFDNMYRSDRVNLMRERATQVVNGLFYIFMNDRKLLPVQWSYCKSEFEQAQLISDYLSGMTDGYAEQRYTELTSGT